LEYNLSNDPQNPSAEHKPLVLEGVNTYGKAQRTVKELIYRRSEKGLTAFIEERTSRESFRSALALRDGLEAELLSLKKARGVVRGQEKTAGFYPQPVSTTSQSKKLQEELSALKKTLNTYRGLTAKAARSAAELRQERETAAGTFQHFDSASFGDLVAGGAYEAGSLEWHEYRSDGIGGSDISKILTYRSTFEDSPAPYRTLFTRKVERIAKPMDEWMRFNTTTAIGRGNSWEEYIRYMCADANSDYHVAFCKTSWEGSEYSYRRANFDGLLLNNSGTPVGIIEVKTGSDRSKWGPVELGLAGVPEEYKHQVLWYAANGRLKFGKIAVLLDDWEYREYNFDMSDPAIQAEVATMFAVTDGFWERVLEARTPALVA
jgi:hypothetical protein